MSMPEQSGDSFDFCVLFRVYFTGKGALYVHFPSDVLASLGIGMLIGKLATTAADSMSRRTRQA